MRAAPLSLALLALGCPTEPEPEPNPIPASVIWEEDDDDDNQDPWDAEAVDTEWRLELVIHGEMEDCSYDQDEDWPYDGDNDNYEIEVPRDGYLDAELDWESDMDADLFFWEEQDNDTWAPTLQASTNSENGPESIVFEDDFDAGDDVVLGVACANGDEGAYTLTVTWEE
jgi:hypothetical protein